MGNPFSPLAYILAAAIFAVGFGAGFPAGKWSGHDDGVKQGRALCNAEHDAAALELIDMAQKARARALQPELGGLPNNDPFARD